MYVQSHPEARFCSHCSSGKIMIIKCYEYERSLRYPVGNVHPPCCRLWPVR